MEELSFCGSEMRLMNVIRDEAPVESGKPVKLSMDRLDWSKSTTYTILRKLVGKGLVVNENSLITVLVPRESVQIMESEKIVAKTFAGLLPKFIASFLGNKSLSDAEAEELIGLINQHKGGSND